MRPPTSLLLTTLIPLLDLTLSQESTSSLVNAWPSSSSLLTPRSSPTPSPRFIKRQRQLPPSYQPQRRQLSIDLTDAASSTTTAAGDASSSSSVGLDTTTTVAETTTEAQTTTEQTTTVAQSTTTVAETTTTTAPPASSTETTTAAPASTTTEPPASSSSSSSASSVPAASSSSSSSSSAASSTSSSSRTSVTLVYSTFTSTYTDENGSVRTGTSVSSSASILPSSDSSSSSSSSSNTGKTWGIIGGVVGGVIVLLGIIFIIYRMSQRRFSNLDDDGEEIKWPELQPDGQSISASTSTLNPLGTRRTGGAGVGDDGDDHDGGGGEWRDKDASYEQLALHDGQQYCGVAYDPYLGSSSAPYPPPANIYPPYAGGYGGSQSQVGFDNYGAPMSYPPPTAMATGRRESYSSSFGVGEGQQHSRSDSYNSSSGAPPPRLGTPVGGGGDPFRAQSPEGGLPMRVGSPFSVQEVFSSGGLARSGSPGSKGGPL